MKNKVTVFSLYKVLCKLCILGVPFHILVRVFLVCKPLFFWCVPNKSWPVIWGDVVPFECSHITSVIHCFYFGYSWTFDGVSCLEIKEKWKERDSRRERNPERKRPSHRDQIERENDRKRTDRREAVREEETYARTHTQRQRAEKGTRNNNKQQNRWCAREGKTRTGTGSPHPIVAPHVTSGHVRWRSVGKQAYPTSNLMPGRWMLVTEVCKCSAVVSPEREWTTLHLKDPQNHWAEPKRM